MTALQEFIEQLLSILDATKQETLLWKRVGESSDVELDQIAEILKDKVVHFLKGDTLKAIRTAELLLRFSSFTEQNLHRALGLRGMAQALLLGKGDIKGAIPLYEEAVRIYQENENVLGEALVYLTYIWALVNLGRYEEAVEKGEWALEIIKKEGSLRDQGTLYNNLATVHTHVGKYRQALEMLTEASLVHQQMGDEGETELALAEGNRALALSFIGRFQDAIEAGEKAIGLAKAFNQITVEARNTHNLGITYLIQGQYNQALRLFEDARRIHITNEQLHEAALCDLSTVDCLILLRRSYDALDKASSLLLFFQDNRMLLEQAMSNLLQAYALKDLGQLDKAVDSLEKARELYLQNEWMSHAATCDLGIASLLFQQGKLEEALEVSRKSIQIFGEFENDRVQGQLLIAEIFLAQKSYEACENILNETLQISIERQWRWLVYKGYYLLGCLARTRKDLARANRAFTEAIDLIERLRGNIMMEFRAGFLEDKQEIYEDMVDLCLEMGEIKQGLHYVERAKSRALLELLAYRPDLSLHAWDPVDESTVNRIQNLRTLREERIRYGIRLIIEGMSQAQYISVQQEIQEIEREITDLWHHLLVTNAHYARETALWEVYTEEFYPYLPDETVLVEYFVLHGKLVCFLVLPNLPVENAIYAIPLNAHVSYIEDLLQSLSVNINTIARPGHKNFTGLLANAQGILARLYQTLIGPLQKFLNNFPNLMIIPHGPLHYLPFQALYDGERYLMERHQISYLPNASLLRYSQVTKGGQEGAIVMGHSFGNRLTHAVKEAELVAELWGVIPHLEDQARASIFAAKAAEANLIHLACHGDFRHDNPLFSGIVLEDSWLTTLDVFNLQLSASLVTLSACQTGRNIVGGGDELLGLMRAFLYAGASSLLLTLWPIADEAAEILMGDFYRALLKGETKSSALQTAMQSMLSNPNPKYHHPYFWASFILVGHSGQF